MKNQRSFELRPENAELIFKALRFRSEDETPRRLQEGIDRAIELCADPEAKVEFGPLRNTFTKQVEVHVVGTRHAIEYLMDMPSLIGTDSGELDSVTKEFDKTFSALAEMRSGTFRGVIERETRMTETMTYYKRLLRFANSVAGKLIYRNVVDQMPERYWCHDLERSQSLKMEEIIRRSCTDFVSRIDISPGSVDVRTKAVEELKAFRRMLDDLGFETRTSLIGTYMQMTTIRAQHNAERFPRRNFRWLDHDVVVDRSFGGECQRPPENSQRYALTLAPVMSLQSVGSMNNSYYNSDFGIAYFPDIQISKNFTVEK